MAHESRNDALLQSHDPSGLVSFDDPVIGEMIENMNGRRAAIRVYGKVHLIGTHVPERGQETQDCGAWGQVRKLAVGRASDFDMGQFVVLHRSGLRETSVGGPTQIMTAAVAFSLA
jgi:hypothetical protein